MEKTIKDRILFLEENKNQIIIDADTHITNTSALHPSIMKLHTENPDYFQGRCISAEDLLTEMNMSGVDMSLTWQNPAGTFYPGNQNDNFVALFNANSYIHNVSVKYENKFIPAGWTDPKALGMEKALELVEVCVKKLGFPIVKLNPAQNQFPIDSDEVIEIVKFIIELGAIPAFHYGADTPYTPVSGLEKLAVRFSPNNIIAVHMGGGGAGYIEADTQYTETRKMGLQNPNIKFILSAKRDTHIESDLITYQLKGEPFSSNISCASDAPYGRQTWNFGGYHAMFKSLKDGAKHTDKRMREFPDLFDDEAVQGYLGRNFAELAIKGYQGILKHFE